MIAIFNKETLNVTITNGNTTSDAAAVLDKTIAAIEFPATVGTSFSFDVSIDGTNYYRLKDKDNADIAITKTAASTSIHQIDPSLFAGIAYVKIVSNATETADVGISFSCLDI